MRLYRPEVRIDALYLTDQLNEPITREVTIYSINQLLTSLFTCLIKITVCP